MVIEDDASISELLQLYLAREGYQVRAAALGADGVELVREESPALVVLDLMLPDGSGFDFLKSIRSFCQAPLIILTAKDAEQDKILGLELGADDYMVKPFSPGELVARARAVERRMTTQEDAAAAAQVLGTLELLPAERTVRVESCAGGAHPKGVRPAALSARQPWSGSYSRATARRGVGLQLIRRRSHSRCAHRAVAQEAGALGAGDPDGVGSGLQGRCRGEPLRRGPSIRRRLVFALAGVSLFTLVVVGAVFYLFLGWYVIDRQRDLLLDQAVEVAEQVQGVSESMPAAMTPGMRGRGMVTALLRADLRVLPAGSGIVVFSGTTVVARVGTAPTKPEVLESLRVQAESVGGSEPGSVLTRTALGATGKQVAAIVAAAPIESAGSITGLAVVTLARSDAFSYRTGILRGLLISGGIAVCLAIVVGLVLGARMTRPLRRLSAAARDMAGGSYQQPVTGSYPGEIQQLADDLESMRQEVRRSEDSLRGFVSSAAHELRTPLTSIQGFSQALLDGTAVTAEERSRSAAAIYRESTRLRRLVDTLLTLSRYDSHEFRPSLGRVSVEGLVREEADRLLQLGMVEDRAHRGTDRRRD